MFLSVVSAVVSASPSPSASPLVKVVEVTKEVVTLPNWFWPLLMVLGLAVLGWVASWLQAFINSRKALGEKLNVLVTAGYAVVVPAAVAVWQAFQAGQIDLSTFNTAVQTAGVVILASWLRHNGAKLTKKTPVYAVDGAEAVV